MGEAIRGKVIQLVVWTVTFTTIFTSYANKGFSSVANRNNDTFYTYNRTLDSNGIIILAIPAVILAIIVMTVWLKANRRVIALPMARKIGLSRFIETGGISDSRIMGFITFFVKGVKILFTRVAKTGGSGNSNSNSHNSSGGNGNSLGRYAADSDSSSNRLDDNRKADEEARIQSELKQKKANDDKARFEAELKRKKANDDDKARFEAKLKQDHANYLKNQAIKQDRVNSENIHAQARRNYALNAQNEANQAKRDLRK